MSLRTREVAWYGWRPPLPDPHRPKFAALRRVVDSSSLPTTFDLRPQMPGVYDQGELGSCHDADTEVLTRRGWVLFSELEKDDELASVNPETSQLIFEKPTRLIAFPYKGDMYYGHHQQLDFVVTPDHTMLVRKWNEREKTLESRYSYVAMKDVGWYAGFMTSVRYDGTEDRPTFTLKGIPHKRKVYRVDREIPMDAWLRFLGIYLAEGTMLRTHSQTYDEGGVGTKVRVHYKIQLAASKMREKQFIRETLDELGVHYLELDDRFTFENKQIYAAMEEMGLKGVKAPDKFVPEFVFNLPGHRIEQFLLGHFMGDGCEQNGHRNHYTSSWRLADDLQRLAFLAGRRAYIASRESRRSTLKNGRVIVGRYPEYRVGVSQEGFCSLDRKANIRVEPYDGMVYCAEVPTYHTLVTRRNGKILVAGNCTANALGGAVHYLLKKEGRPSFVPSRLFIYYNERVIEGSVREDAGASLSDGVTVLKTLGAPHEDLWWYNIAKFRVKPNRKVYADALNHRVADALSVNNARVDEIRTSLASGFPVVFGFTVYESFEGDAVARTGKVPMPGRHEAILGGHAVLLVGFDHSNRTFIVRNSWGADWGLKGYFSMPYDYVTNTDLADDFWALESVA